MSAVKRVQEVAASGVRKFVVGLSDSEKKALLVWSQKAVAIRDDNSLGKVAKVKALNSIENGEIARIFMATVFKVAKEKTWTNQSWARRLGVAGVATGLTFGGASVGIATMGAGMGVPLIVMTAAGGVILGAAIDEIKKELKDKIPKDGDQS